MIDIEMGRTAVLILALRVPLSVDRNVDAWGAKKTKPLTLDNFNVKWLLLGVVATVF